MSEISRVPQSIVPARHRMSFANRLKDNVQRIHETIKPAESKHRRQHPLRTRLGMVALSAAALLGIAVQTESAPADSKQAIITEDMQETLTKKRYDTCTVTEMKTWETREGNYLISAQWLLNPNVDANAALERYRTAPNVTVWLPRPVIRPFGIVDGEAFIGKPITRVASGSAHNPKDISSFSAVLPRPQGNTRYMLSVGSMLTIDNADGSQTDVYAEKPCAELTLTSGEIAGHKQWHDVPPDPLLIKRDYYAVNNHPAGTQ